MIILIYAFTNPWGTNISRRTFSELQKLIAQACHLPEGEGGAPEPRGFVFLPIFGHPRSFFQKYIRNDQYDLIIGLGDFYGNITKIRIETTANNRYGDQPIYDFSPYKLELSLPPLDLVDPNCFDISEFMGTYNCNWIAYTIQNHINQHKLPTKQLFFHLPQRTNAFILAQNISKLLLNNKIIQ